MKTYPVPSRHGSRPARFSAGLAASIAIALAAPSHAAQFEFRDGDIYGSWDTTLSYGAIWRVQGRDRDIIATANGGNGRSANIDDGNLNYKTGLVSSAYKATSELEFNWGNAGFFVRGTGFFDTEADDTLRTDLPSDSEDKVKSSIDLLDAFVFYKAQAGSVPIEFRVGEQVISWGESTFIQQGINIINHVDVTKLRVPGSELREALLPQDIVYVNAGLTENITVEGFYQYDWDDTEPDPAGTLFSTNDFGVDGGEKVMLGFGAISDLGTDFTPLGGSFDPDYNFVPRIRGRDPSDGGQYGFAGRIYFPNFSNGTEIGLFYVNYHSRLPVLSGRTGTQEGIGNGAGAATAVGAAAQGIASGLPFDAAVSTAAATAVATSAGLGGSYSLAQATEAATVGANTQLSGGDAASLAVGFANDEYADTAGYFTEFPEDIEVYGVSFNTYLFNTGIAWQGEYSFTKDRPLQLDDVELLFAALSPLNTALAPLPLCPTAPTETRGALGCFNQLGEFGVDEEIRGWKENDVSQVQTTLTYISGPLLGSDAGAFVWEGGYTYVHDFDSPDSGGPNGVGLRYNGPGTSVSGNAALASTHFGEVEKRGDFPNASSWGYRFAMRLDYNNFIGPWTVSPRLAFSHDVNGNTPGPGGNFREGRKAYTLGIRGTLQNQYELDISYTDFSGAGRHNLTNDRDFIAFNAKFSF